MNKGQLRPRSTYPHWHAVHTRWRDLDIYAHVNNVEYYTWFDTVIQDWLIGQGLLDLARSDPVGLVVETGCRYAAPIGFPQTVEVGLGVSRIGNSSVTYHLGVFEERADAAAAEAHFTHVYVGRESRRPTPLSERWRASLQRLVV